MKKARKAGLAVVKKQAYGQARGWSTEELLRREIQKIERELRRLERAGTPAERG